VCGCIVHYGASGVKDFLIKKDKNMLLTGVGVMIYPIGVREGSVVDLIKALSREKKL
jgi:hypothetical protein